MRRFHSYGPVKCRKHFCVERKEMVNSCLDSLIDDPDDCGHYFTIYAPRQTGKTWLTIQVKKEIEARYGDRFLVGSMSVQGVVIKEDDPEEVFLTNLPQLFWETFKLEIGDAPRDWKGFKSLFSLNNGLFDRPVVLFIDEFDSLPVKVIDLLVGLFRDMYQKRDSYLLHGLALIGVRAALGVSSDRGSPFNIQRSLHIPNLTKGEVEELYRQYQEESGQTVDPVVVEKVFHATNGQPGLVSWFGELLTEKCNPGRDKTIGVDAWKRVWLDARTVEPNNNLLNLIAKARKPKYRGFLTKLFGAVDEPFMLYDATHGYLYMHGVIEPEEISGPNGASKRVCRFASPFIQRCLYDALGRDLIGVGTPIPSLDPLDDLEDVFEGPDLDLPGLLKRYKDYLARLKTNGIDPWKDRPKRADMRITEAVGHFHLYAWLNEAVEDHCVVSPEFPAGNGRVDLHLKCRDKQGVIEVKSFKNLSRAKAARGQAARYAKSLTLANVTLAMFTPAYDETVLEKLSGREIIDGVTVTVVAIGWP
ncbi:MAG: hypothetical protein GY866_40985 [Proteobacteria bacterium]|nr:hypothetical protein [Pseudomonadota bacterium]